MSNNDDNKKKKKRLALWIPLGFVGAGAVATAIAVPIALNKNTNTGADDVVLESEDEITAKGISVSAASIVQGKESTIDLKMPEGKTAETDIKAMKITIGNKELTIGTDYKIEGNRIIIFEETMKNLPDNDKKVHIESVTIKGEIKTINSINYKGATTKGSKLSADKIIVNVTKEDGTKTTLDKNNYEVYLGEQNITDEVRGDGYVMDKTGEYKFTVKATENKRRVKEFSVFIEDEPTEKKTATVDASSLTEFSELTIPTTVSSSASKITFSATLSSGSKTGNFIFTSTEGVVVESNNIKLSTTKVENITADFSNIFKGISTGLTTNVTVTFKVKTVKAITATSDIVGWTAGSSIKAEHLTVKLKYSDESLSDPIKWGSEYSISKNSTEIENFDTVGYQFTETDLATGSVTFSIQYLQTTSITSTVEITVDQLGEFTIDQKTGLITMTEDCKKMSNGVFIPEKIGDVIVKGIAYEGFMNSSAKRFTFANPENLTTISEKAFYNCTSLCSQWTKNVFTIPQNVTKIGPNAFYQCSNIKYINILNKATQKWIAPSRAVELNVWPTDTTATNLKDCNNSASSLTNWGATGIRVKNCASQFNNVTWENVAKACNDFEADLTKDGAIKLCNDLGFENVSESNDPQTILRESIVNSDDNIGTVIINKQPHSIRCIDAMHDSIWDEEQQKTVGKSALTFELINLLSDENGELSRAVTSTMNSPDSYYSMSDYTTCYMHDNLVGGKNKYWNKSGFEMLTDEETGTPELLKAIKTVEKTVTVETTNGNWTDKNYNTTLFPLTRFEMDAEYTYSQQGETYHFWSNHTVCYREKWTLTGKGASYRLIQPYSDGSKTDGTRIWDIWVGGFGANDAKEDRGTPFAFCI